MPEPKPLIVDILGQSNARFRLCVANEEECKRQGAYAFPGYGIWDVDRNDLVTNGWPVRRDAQNIAEVMNDYLPRLETKE